MHESVMQWVALKVAEYGLRGVPCMELGSYDVNGSVRSLVQQGGSRYVGVDIREGPGVDVVVAPGSPLPLAADDEPWPLVVCTEMLEHDPRPWETFEAVNDVLGLDGLLLLTTRGPGFPLHEYPGDFWRFTQSSLRVLCDDAGLEVVELMDDPQAPGVFLVARG